MRVLLAAVFLMGWTGSATAEGVRTLGFGRLTTNDRIGDGDDRWRTGSFVMSMVRGKGWDGALPERPFALMDYRARAEIIAPDALNGTGSRTRPYAGMVGVGAHTLFSPGPFEASVGADLLFVGPQTGILDLHADFNDAFSAPRVGQEDNELGNDTRLQGIAELAWPVSLGPAVMRPYVEVQDGAEALIRFGGDLVIGGIVQDDLMLRDPVTGHLYRGTQTAGAGSAYVIGADWTYVDDSIFLPGESRAELTEERTRLRAGVHWQSGGRSSIFYGMTYLSEEFESQEEGQILGSLNLSLDF